MPICSKVGGHTADGMCDMTGNVWEWIWHDSAISSGVENTVRGGSWDTYANYIDNNAGLQIKANRQGAFFGFRLARTVKSDRGSAKVKFDGMQHIQDSKCADSVKDFVRARRPEIQSCYQERLTFNSGLKGRLVIATSIDSDGKVNSAKAITNSTNDTALALCTEEKIRNWSFPTGCADNLVLPFSFNSGSQ